MVRSRRQYWIVLRWFLWLMTTGWWLECCFAQRIAEVNPEDVVGMWYREVWDGLGELERPRTDVNFLKSDGAWTQLTIWGEPPAMPHRCGVGLVCRWRLAGHSLKLYEPKHAVTLMDGGEAQVEWVLSYEIVYCSQKHLVLKVGTDSDERIYVFTRGAGRWDNRLDGILRPLGPEAWKAFRSDEYPEAN